MEGERRLRRVLGPLSLTALGVGAVIGAGIFVMTGTAARDDAGPAIMLSYCVAGLGCLLAALCYAEFASLAPVAGSAYTYSYATLGEGFAWVIGWDLVLEYAVGCATVASGWSGHFDEFLHSSFGLRVPAVLAADPFSMPGAWFNLPAVVVMAVVTAVLVVGIRESVTVNTFLVGVKLAVVLFVVLVGWSYIDRGNWTGIPVEARHVPADPAQKWGLLGLLGLDRWLVALDDRIRSPFAPYGLSGFMLGASIIFFSYIGFDSISTHSEEARRPHRDVPLAILASLGICTVL
jgi:APA family basic amino acid/polyamine antiporter